MRNLFKEKGNFNCTVVLKKGNILFLFLSISMLILFPGCKKDIHSQLSADSNLQLNQRTSNQPNIILFVANDFGFELPTYNGGQSYSTPNMDFIAANGIHFTQATNHPDGSPSRMAILTGKYNFRNYVTWGYLPPKENTLGNLLKDAGYETFWAGKWQMSGGDKSIHKAGFDDYIAFLPFGHGQRVGRYKSPKLFVDNDFLPESEVEGRYSEDILFEYMSNFIEDNKQKPFFVVYSTLLPAAPWVPTPDDPEYANWNPKFDQLNQDREKYFPSMVTYLDKIVGQTMAKLSEEGLAQNTLILFTSATQSYSKVVSQWNGQTVSGTKMDTRKSGNTMPIIGYWPGTIAPGIKSPTLVDFTDFLPTLADAAKIPVPTNYGYIDGVSFYDNMIQASGKDRDWVFCHWDNNPMDNVSVERWINDTTYKLYDTVGNGNGKFYNISLDPDETNPIKTKDLTKEEKKRKRYFKKVMQQMH